MRYGIKLGKRDENESEIVSTLRQVGATVEYGHDIDLLVGFRGVNYLIEVKTGGGKLTPCQIKKIRTWSGKISVVRSPEQALRVIGVIK